MLWQQVSNGLTLGGIYSIVALGYTLVFGVLQILNMAHGEIFMFSAFIGLMLVTHAQVPLVIALLAAAATGALLGFLLERFALRPLRRKAGASHLAPLISTIGASIILENLALNIFGPETRPFPVTLGNIYFQVGEMKVYLTQLLILLISLVLMIGLSLWLGRTKAGTALRATAESLETASLMGVNTQKMITLALVIASAMGGVGGVLVGMAFNAVSPQMGLAMGLKGLAIIILGGMGSVKGAIAGGFILGVTEVMSVAYGASGYRDAIAFLMIIIILLARPQGMFGRAVVQERR